ncbi:MAG: hypothetical protein QHH07_11125, partial [Sedimentisphaerales bacterium]|nr:hypothetical protein [Sedimentisphaerales bacterium]
LAIADICNKSSVGGESGLDALKHIQIGVPPCEFPEPDPGLFAGYATNVIDNTTDVTKAETWSNVRIVADANPKFAAKTEFLGVVFIEPPNQVEFTGDVKIRGIIVGDGDVSDDSSTNKIIFKGNVECYSVDSLPETFGDLRTKVGTFIVAPGFEVQFGGNFKTHTGAIAANGIKFWGNAGGTVRGSTINYSSKPAELSGNTDLRFNRSGIETTPAGFVPSIRLVYNPSSYDEPHVIGS